MNDVHVPFHDLLSTRAASGKSHLQVPGDLFGLRTDVALADHGPGGIHAVLAANVDRSDRALGEHGLRVHRTLVKTFGIQIRHAPLHGVLRVPRRSAAARQ